MKINDYLRQRAAELKRTSSQIKDFAVFDFNYIPPQPLMRQEAKVVIDACVRYLASGIPNHLFVFGSRGSGKTLTVRYISKLLEDHHPVRVLYANCRQHNTSFKILAHLLGVRPRGCELEELWHRFCELYQGRLILVLDEVDLLSDKDYNRDLLYLISRSPRNYMALLLSNHPKFLSTVDESVRSTLQSEVVHFRNYDAQQIVHILEDRARTGLRRWRRGELGRIAALTTRTTNSDVRVAIKTLYYAALESGAEVEAIFHRARRDLTAEVLADLSDRNLLILKAAVELPEPLVKSVYQRYRQLSMAERTEPFSYVYYYAGLTYLQSIGLVLMLSTKVGRTYTNRVQILFQPDVLQRLCETRFGSSCSVSTLR